MAPTPHCMAPAYPVAPDSPSGCAVVCPDRFTAGRGFLFDALPMTKPKRKVVATGKPGAELVARQVGTAYVPRPKHEPLLGDAVIPAGLVIQRGPSPVAAVVAGSFAADWLAKRGGAY